ncbi:MAG: outer membrane protein [Flavobacteriaceae bacterium]
MTYFKQLLLAGAVALTAAFGQAQAADLPPIVPPPAVEQPVEIGSAWYLRGDVSYDFYGTPSLYQGSPYVPLVNEAIDDTWNIGLGFGYQFNAWFRGDLTAEYRGKVNIYSESQCGACAGNTQHNVDITSWVFMANAYVDFGTWASITPYVGAGFGAAYHRASVFQNNGAVIPPSGITSLSGNSEWEFVWAVMAGVSYDISQNMKLDIGYRYMDLGKVSSGTLTNCCSTAPAIIYDDLRSHEVRVGLRYLFDTGYDYAPVTTSY